MTHARNELDVGGSYFWWRKQETGGDWAQFTTDERRLEEGEWRERQDRGRLAPGPRET